LFELNKSFTIRSANEICRNVFQYAPAELEGKMFKDIMTSSAELKEIQEKATDKTFWNGILKMKDRSGKEIMMLSSVGQVPDSVNNDFMYLIYGKDITHLN
jgi:PAS domain S-box-containing protein